MKITKEEREAIAKAQDISALLSNKPNFTGKEGLNIESLVQKTMEKRRELESN